MRLSDTFTIVDDVRVALVFLIETADCLRKSGTIFHSLPMGGFGVRRLGGRLEPPIK